jgi:LPLT family lysophospholipid transporter-like MFS transporter
MACRLTCTARRSWPETTSHALPPIPRPPRHAHGFKVLITAQFFSALADNALLIVCIALLMERGLPPWLAPMLKFSFTLAYVLLAPFVGALADAVPKGRLMMAMNGLKMLGVLAMLGGMNPLMALAVAGMGAAAYAPAKYGLATELLPPHRLVAANAWIEVSTVCAVVFGTALGGLLISPWMLLAAAGHSALSPTSLALMVLLSLYALAAGFNLGIPDSGVRYAPQGSGPAALTRVFWRAQRRLWADEQGALSMAVTTLFWGAAAVLQFAVLRWATDVLGLPLSQGAYLQATVAVGIVVGAALAGRWVRMDRAARVLPLGVLMGAAVPLAAQATEWWLAVPAMVLVGALGGALVVPLNALLQHRGHVLLTAGRSIAVQNFNENASVLVMLAVYAALLAVDMQVQTLMAGLGLIVGVFMAVLWWRQRWRLGPARVLPRGPDPKPDRLLDNRHGRAPG